MFQRTTTSQTPLISTETLADFYYKRVPLPKIPGYLKLDQEASYVQVANTIYKQRTQTTPLGDIVNSYTTPNVITRNVHGSYVAISRCCTNLSRCATPTNLRS